MVSTFITGTGYGPGGNHIDYPQALTLDKSGNLYVGNANNGDIVKVTPQGVASDYFAIPDPEHYPHSYGLTFDTVGSLYVAWAPQGAVAKLPAGGGSETVFASGLDRPQGGASDLKGNVYVYTNETLAGATALKITPNGEVSTF